MRTGRPKKLPEELASERLNGCVTRHELAALHKILKQDKVLFPAWLRATIRAQAAERGIVVDKPPSGKPKA